MGCEVDKSICVGGFNSLYTFVVAFLPSRVTRTSRKGSLFSDSSSLDELDGWMLAVEMLLESVQGFFDVGPQHESIVNIEDPYLGGDWSVERSEHFVRNSPCIGWQQQERAESPLLLL